jgi:hypothetical protein
LIKAIDLLLGKDANSMDYLKYFRATENCRKSKRRPKIHNPALRRPWNVAAHGRTQKSQPSELVGFSLAHVGVTGAKSVRGNWAVMAGNTPVPGHCTVT